MDKLILEADETGKRLDAYLAENHQRTLSTARGRD